MTANTKQDDARRHGVGGNKGPKLPSDPGPATDYQLSGPLALRQHAIDPDMGTAFVAAIASQGDENTRQYALSNADRRARASLKVSHRAYRVFTELIACVRWSHRYCSAPLEAVAFLTGFGDGSNVGRILRELRDVGFIAMIGVPRKAGGWPMTFCTVVCTSEDRSGQSWETLRAQARERYNGAMRAKRNGCDWPLPDTPDPIRYGDELASRHHNVSTVQNPVFEEGNSSPQRHASRHHNDQTVYRGKCREEEDLVGETRSDADATSLPEIILPSDDLSAEPDATNIIREEHREAFRQLADTFGRRPGEMVISPTPRTTTDPILDGIVRPELASYLYDQDGHFTSTVAERALTSALRATQLMTGRNANMGSMAKCFEKALRDAAAEIQRAEVNRLAKLRVDSAIQQEIAEKRLRGVREGRGRPRKSSSTSWSDLAADYAADQETR